MNPIGDPDCPLSPVDIRVGHLQPAPPPPPLSRRGKYRASQWEEAADKTDLPGGAINGRKRGRLCVSHLQLGEEAAPLHWAGEVRARHGSDAPCPHGWPRVGECPPVV